MVNQGVFGYIIGKKKRMMYVQQDADLLWQILVREIYILMNHFKTIDLMKEAFEKIKTINNKSKPKPSDIEKCKQFAEFPINDWTSLLRYCQSSYINLLEAGYIINEPDELGEIFILDFNKGVVNHYRKDLNGKSKQIQTSTIEEIMEFDEMPITKTYTEIVTEMNTEFIEYYKKYIKIEEEINKLLQLKTNAQQQGAMNIELKVINLLHDMNSEKNKINVERRVFYKRLNALDLIEE